MSFTLSEILEWSGGKVANLTELGSDSKNIRVEKVSPLAKSGAPDLAYFFSRHYEKELPSASPGILITGEAFIKPLGQAGLPLWKKSAVIACKDPYFAMAILSEKFAAKLSSVAHTRLTSDHSSVPKKKIHPTAIVHPSAEIGNEVEIGPHCVIDEKAKIGARTVIYPGCTIGVSATLGEDCVIFPQVTIYEWTQIGSRVRIHSGAVIGADGFGYAPKVRNGKIEGHQKIYHLGKVVIGDDVEIGANTCIDRATVGETFIGSKAKIDNLVQIGHNVSIGEGAILCGTTAIAGSATVGKYVYVGGNTGISNQVNIGDGAKIGACSLISKDVPAGETALGNPQRDQHEHFRAHAILSRLVAERRSK